MKEFNRECVMCKVEFTTTYQIQKYCSEDCRNKSLIKPKAQLKEVGCNNCGGRFKQKASKQIFCSKGCQKDFHAKRQVSIKVEKRAVCANCETVFVSEFWRKYCTDECREEFYKSKTNSKCETKSIIAEKVIAILEKAKSIKPMESLGVVISEFTLDSFTEKIKNEVRERDGHSCKVCETKSERLEVHHILRRKLGGSNELDNLITLCVGCHRAIETGDEEHAIKVCEKNAKIVSGRGGRDDLTNPEKINILISCLEDVFETINSEKGFEEKELLLKISKALSNVQ